MGRAPPRVLEDFPKGSTVIYLPTYAQRQLEQADPSRKWYDHLPYHLKPSDDFPLQVYFTKEEMKEVNPITQGSFNPALVDNIDDIVERMQDMAGVAAKASARK